MKNNKGESNLKKSNKGGVYSKRRRRINRRINRNIFQINNKTYIIKKSNIVPTRKLGQLFIIL